MDAWELSAGERADLEYLEEGQRGGTVMTYPVNRDGTGWLDPLSTELPPINDFTYRVMEQDGGYVIYQGRGYVSGPHPGREYADRKMKRLQEREERWEG